MKPRPILSTLVPRRQSAGTRFANLLCQRTAYTRLLVPALTLRQSALQLRCIESLSLRHASTNAAAQRSQKPHTQPAVPPPIKSPPSTPIPEKPQASKTITVLTLKAKELLNPPPFTYAPEIDVPSRDPNQYLVKYLYTVGRKYLDFYKTGISHVRQTLKLAKALRARVNEAQSSSLRKEKPKPKPEDILSRAEWQVLRRSRTDKFRLPAFGLLVLLLGEWLPLVVVYITPVIPEACRIPTQVMRNLRGIEKRRAIRLDRISQLQGVAELRSRVLSASREQDNPSKSATTSTSTSTPTPTSVSNMTYLELARKSAELDCHARPWDWSTKLLGIKPPTWLLVRNVQRKIDYLRTDDALIVRGGGWAALGGPEVQRACVERGIAVVGKKEGELRKALSGWRGV